MTKFRLTMTVVSEYEVDSTDYATRELPKPTLAQMIEIDRKGYLEDPAMALQDYDSISVVVEVVD